MKRSDMSSTMQSVYALFFLLLLHISCGTSSELPRRHDNSSYVGQLDDSTYNTLKLFLGRTVASKLNDTIIVKYDFNKETCWGRLDQNNRDYIMGFVTRTQAHLQKLRDTRPNVSFFNFREPGDKINKIIKWNNSILIDSSRQLFNLLFAKPYSCGSSIIVLPDKRYVFLRSDPHSTALNYTKQQMEALFSAK